MVKGLFDAEQEFPSVAAALAEHKAERNLDLEQLLQSWALPQRSANAARLCCAIRTAVGSSGGSSAGVTAEPVSEGWTTDSWAQADELRLLRRDGSLVTALSKARCPPHPTGPSPPRVRLRVVVGSGGRRAALRRRLRLHRLAFWQVLPPGRRAARGLHPPCSSCRGWPGRSSSQQRGETETGRERGPLRVLREPNYQGNNNN